MLRDSERWLYVLSYQLLRYGEVAEISLLVARLPMVASERVSTIADYHTCTGWQFTGAATRGRHAGRGATPAGRLPVVRQRRQPLAGHCLLQGHAPH